MSKLPAKSENLLIGLVSSLTVKEFAERVGMSVEDVVLLVTRTTSRDEPVEARPKQAPLVRATRVPTANGVKQPRVDVRTQDGRDKYDAAILDALKEAGKPIGSVEIRKRVGGTPNQARAALNRWIEKGAVTYEGQARATVYHVV